MPNLGLGTTLTQLGRAAKDITSTLETGLQNVAENLEGAFVTLGEPGTTDRTGCVTRTASYSSDRDPSSLLKSPPAPSSPASSSANGEFEGSERERFFESGTQSGASGMGCGSSYDHRTADPPGQAPPAPALHCDMCAAKFSFISRKRSCSECGNVFCSACLPSERGAGSGKRTCARCGVLNKRPPHRGELMKLRVKDLQHFLTRKRINIKSCVEKKDLVELVLQHSQASSPIDSTGSGTSQDNVTPANTASRLPSAEAYNDNSIRVSDQVPLERSSNFPKNYVESSHRREWFQEKFGDEDDVKEDIVEEVVETPVEQMEIVEEITPVQVISDNDDSEDEVMSVVVDLTRDTDTGDEIIIQDSNDDNDHKDSHSNDDQHEDEEEIPTIVETLEEEVEGAVGGQVDDASTPKPASDPKPIGAKRTFDHLSDNMGGSSLPSSPRRFANHGLVYLSEIETLEDLNELSTKQIKDLLAMNRVNFKGCVEKEELLKILRRLWKQEQKNKENIETMDDDSLCKICMDSPIDCVMLECGHMCTCTNCGKQMAECPICRQYVVRVVKTFKA